MSSKKPLIVITGASSGIGAETAKFFSKAGYPLLLVARRVEAMKKLNLPNTLVEQVDVRDVDAFAKAVKKAEDLYGPVDLLVNNAGVMFLDQLVDQKPERYKTMVEINILGVLNGIHVVLKGMLERKKGSIINVSSIAGRKAFANHAAYCGTKFAVHGLTEALREEVSGSNVRVMIIAPGVTETELLSHNDKKIVDDYSKWKQQMTVLTSEDIAKSIQFMYEMPPHACIRELVIGPTLQSS